MPSEKLTVLASQTPAGSIGDADLCYVVQAGASKGATFAQVATYATGKIPTASDAITTATALRLGCWGDSLTAGTGGTPYPTQLSPLINRDCFNGGVGGDTSTQIKVRFLAASDKYNFATVIWAGRNNFSAQSTVLADIAAMVAALGHTRYIVLSVLNQSGEGIGTTAYTQIIALNMALASTYGAHYFDMRSYLVSQFNPSLSPDVIDHSNDVPPTSLRSDSIHLNTAGYLLVAQQVAAKIATLNPPVEYLVATNMGALMAAPAGPIGSVEPTAGTFTNVVVGEAITFTDQVNGSISVPLINNTTFIGENIFASGPNGNVTINRRDNSQNAFVFYSPSGDLGVFNSTLGTNALVIFGADSSVLFAGPVVCGKTVTLNTHTSPITTDADGATVTFDLSVTDWHQVTLGGSRTFAVTNPKAGQSFTVRVIQGSGNWQPTWFGTITWFTSDFSPPTMPATAGGVLVATFKCITPGTYDGFWCGNSSA